MDLPHITERLDANRPDAMARAAEIVRGGGLVAFPTETVYGLGANALSASAVEGIFTAKRRPHWDPLIVHVSDRAMLEQVCVVPQAAEALMERFWPGPLTLLLPRTAAVPDAVTAGRALVGVRMPHHAVALELIRQAGVPVAAPSANTFGHISPTTAAHVLGDLDGRIDAVLDGGACVVGVESTVAGLTEKGVLVYRPGWVTTAMLASVVGARGVSSYVAVDAEDPTSLPSPGVGVRHYAPRARLLLVSPDEDAEHTLAEPVTAVLRQGLSVGALLPDGWALPPGCPWFAWGDWSAPEQLAQQVFAGLRSLDERGVAVIVCPVPSGKGIAEAIRDRLEKAARAK